MRSDTTFGTERLLIRPFQLDDTDAILTYAGDPEVMRFETCGVLSRGKLVDGLQRNLGGGFAEMLPLGFRGVVLRDSGALIGECGLHRLRHVDGEPVEITYKIARSHWGQGFATEAAQTLVDHGFGGLDLGEIVAAIHPENAASIRVAKKLGLEFARKIEWPEQGLVDLYSITSEQYRQRANNR